MAARSVDYVVVKHKIARVETSESVHCTEENPNGALSFCLISGKAQNTGRLFVVI